MSVIPVKNADKRAYMLASVLLFTMGICIFVTSRDNIALCLHGFVEPKDSKSSVIGKLKKGTVSTRTTPRGCQSPSISVGKLKPLVCSLLFCLYVPRV